MNQTMMLSANVPVHTTQWGAEPLCAHTKGSTGSVSTWFVWLSGQLTVHAGRTVRLLVMGQLLLVVGSEGRQLFMEMVLCRSVRNKAIPHNNKEVGTLKLRTARIMLALFAPPTQTWLIANTPPNCRKHPPK